MIALGRAACVLAGALAWLCAASLGAHSGLRFSSPLDGSTLGAAPQQIRLTFIEQPEAALSTVRVTDPTGATFQDGSPEPAADDRLSLVVPLKPLPRGVYTVRWRVVSAVDGHASTGVFVFGVQVTPTATEAATQETESSAGEAAARTIFLMGVLIALGAFTASVLVPSSGVVLASAGAGVIVSGAGVALLAFAQAAVAGVDPTTFATTAVGRALMWRAAAVIVMAAGWLLAARRQHRARGTERTWGIVTIGVGTIATIAVHAYAGHAAAGRWSILPTVAAQAAHMAAAGWWLGGLAVLIIDMRSGDRARSAQAFARFASIAAMGLFVVVATGVLRSVQELSRWSDLLNTSYGATVLIKSGLLVFIAFLGGINRYRNVARAATDPRPLRRTSVVELGAATFAIVAAAFLGTLSPPAAARAAAAIEISGSDYGTTATATLQMMSDQPGPNRFTVSIVDYDSREMVDLTRVQLRFTPLDDPGVPATLLTLQPDAEGRYSGSGANVAFAGRWRADVLAQRANSSVEIPLEFEARAASHSVSVLRAPGQPITYTADLNAAGFVRIELDPAVGRTTTLCVTTFNILYEPLPVDRMVVTTGERTRTNQLAITRTGRHQFSGVFESSTPLDRLTVIATTESGSRLHAIFVIDPQ